MNKRIVTEPCRLIRKIARDKLKGNWLYIFIAMMEFYIFTSFAGDILDFFFRFNQPVEVGEKVLTDSIPFGGSIYELFLKGAFAYGLGMFLLTFFRTRKSDYTLMFDGFSVYFKALILSIYVSFFTFLWTLCFVVPGIIAMLRYSQAIYIMIDHPELRPMQCIRMSCALMTGNITKLFLLYLSYFGWLFLAAIPNSLFVNYAEVSGFNEIIIGFVVTMPVMLAMGYLKMGVTAFYELLTGNLVVVQEQSKPEFVKRGENIVEAEYEIKDDDSNIK